MRNYLRSIRGFGSERLRLLGFLTGGHFFIHWFQQLFPVVLPSLKAGLGLNDVEVGALNSARQLTNGTLDLPSGILADSMVRYRGLILGLAIASMGTAYFLMGAAPFFVWAVLGSGLVGLGTALWHPAAAASLSNRFPEHRATVLAIHGMGATVSDTLTPLGVGFLLVIFSWDSFLRFQVLPALILGFLIWRGMRGLFTEGDSGSWRSAQIREIADLAKTPVFLGICISTSLLQMGRLVVITFLPIYLQEHLRYSPVGLGFHIALLHAMGTFSQPVLGFLSDRFGRKAVLVPSFMVLGVLFLLLAVAVPGFQLALVISAIGLFFYTLMNVINAAVMDVAGAKIHASSYGLTSLLTQIAVFPTPIVVGFMIGKFGMGSAFLSAGGLVILGGLILAPFSLYRGSAR